MKVLSSVKPSLLATGSELGGSSLEELLLGGSGLPDKYRVVRTSGAAKPFLVGVGEGGGSSAANSFRGRIPVPKTLVAGEGVKREEWFPEPIGDVALHLNGVKRVFLRSEAGRQGEV